MLLYRIICKLGRFIRNPQPYIDVLRRRAIGHTLTIKLYRRCWLPLIVFKVRHKKRINVIFLAMNPAMWRYDGVYRRLANDKRFKPVIVTAMQNITDENLQIKDQEEMLSYFKERGFSVICGYNAIKREWIDLGTLNPDIIFYTQPYDGVIECSFEYYSHWGSLFCYTPYSFQLSETNWNWNNNLQQYCWKLFYVGGVQLKQCERFSRVGKQNVVSVGYCFEEEYEECLKCNNAVNDAWRNDNRKRIIWAPHHSIRDKEWIKVSSFLDIADLMVKLREEYADKIVFAFKPHPVLKTKLYNVWGQERTDAYYDDWAKSGSSFDAQGDYHALFAGSDAMIHCSGSFIVEYLYTGKPVAYVYSKIRNPPDIGLIGNTALDAHYPIYNEIDIRHFLDEVIFGGCDSMRVTRQKVVDKYLKSSNGKMFSENVFNSIVEGLRL